MDILARSASSDNIGPVGIATNYMPGNSLTATLSVSSSDS